jgi:uncharacterized membrane protein YkgB
MSTPVSIQSSSRDFIQSQLIEKAGIHSTRFGLVLVLIWIGGMKFTSYEAEGIKPFVENSPLMSFVYQFLSVRSFSAFLGATEILIGLMIASRHFFPRTSAAGSLLATGMFLTTMTFMLSTPGIFEPTAGGFPAVSITGQFLLKDLVLLGAAILTCGEALINRK